MTAAISIDVLIIGGGIAGLWTLARLRREGYRCVLLERLALGAGQTIASQGIIHGGVKYALGSSGHTDASRAIARMPEIWRRCLRGEGEVDLRSARVLSEHQYLWTSPGILGKLGGLGATLAMRADVRRVESDGRPPIFRDAPRSVGVYEVDEPVLDGWSVVEALAAAQGAWCLRPASVRRVDVRRSDDGRVETVSVHTGTTLGGVEFRARGVVCAAGEGNAELRAHFGEPISLMPQTRPLHMVMMRGAPGPLFAHCVGASTLPHLTITSGRDRSGAWVWYVGGAIAEDQGVARDEHEQVSAARRAIGEMLGWIDLDGCAFATCRWNRAEGVPASQSGVRRPEGPTVERSGFGNVVYVWPTKLAFAPLAAERVHAELHRAGVHPGGGADEAIDLPAMLEHAPIGPRPWEGRMVVSEDGTPKIQDVRWSSDRSATQA